jgi:thiol-disulfide isomerase/thioredoxin
MSKVKITAIKPITNIIITNIVKITMIGAILLLTLTIAGSNRVYAGVGGFYKGEDRYRGFYWFEEQSTRSQDIDSQFYYPAPEEAQNAIEARKKAMDDARAQMVELGFREDTPPYVLRQAIVKYKKLEAQMHDGAIRLVHASEMVNFTNPEIANVTEFPTNVYANKIKRASNEQEKILTVKEFAKRFDLLLFVSPDCAYCKSFTPVITNFAKEHGFTLETASLDSKEGKIARNLGINVVPTLVAVGKDAQDLFEISRGLSSLPELEASIVLANDLVNEQRQKFNKSKNKRGY